MYRYLFIGDTKLTIKKVMGHFYLSICAVCYCPAHFHLSFLTTLICLTCQLSDVIVPIFECLQLSSQRKIWNNAEVWVILQNIFLSKKVFGIKTIIQMSPDEWLYFSVFWHGSLKISILCIISVISNLDYCMN